MFRNDWPRKNDKSRAGRHRSEGVAHGDCVVACIGNLCDRNEKRWAVARGNRRSIQAPPVEQRSGAPRDDVETDAVAERNGLALWRSQNGRRHWHA